ncbi:N-formylglutamate amidohydrolase [candidate division KSB1 bacterium]
MSRLPILISIPHGGEKIPDELEDRIRIGKKDILDDIDAFSREVFDLEHRVREVVAADFARPFVDLNRSLKELPPEFPDGVIKSSTVLLEQIYIDGLEPDDELISTLIKRYYRPYHNRIRELAQSEKFILGLDCHSMAPVGPPYSRDPGRSRPLICLGNVNGKSSDWSTIENLAECFRKTFSMGKSQVTLNDPFAGGYITKTYGNEPLPWIQVELNRSLYLEHFPFLKSSFKMNKTKVEKLRRKVEKTLEMFCGRLLQLE